jgi:hypothetical protein
LPKKIYASMDRPILLRMAMGAAARVEAGAIDPAEGV